MSDHMIRYFDLDCADAGCAVHCKMFLHDGKPVRSVVIVCHGFTCSKEAVGSFPETVLRKNGECAVIAFDLPGHGESRDTELSLRNCDRFILTVSAYVREEFPDARLYCYGVSFGGFLGLKFAIEHKDEKIIEKYALRCPAVNIFDILLYKLMDEPRRNTLLQTGKCTVGQDSTAVVSMTVIRELRDFRLPEHDFTSVSGNILIIQGTADEIVDCEAVKSLAEKNGIRIILPEGADHGFTDPAQKSLAIREHIAFLGL